jgi:hypothetical protein
MTEKCEGKTAMVSESDIRDLRSSINQLHTKLDDRENRLFDRLDRDRIGNLASHDNLQKQLSEVKVTLATLAHVEDVLNIEKKVDSNKTKVNIMFTSIGVVFSTAFAWVLSHLDRVSGA